MSKLADIVEAPGFELQVKQFECVLDFVTAVEQAMEARRLTQSAFARVLGKSRAWVSKVLRRKPNLTFFTAVEIADALEMDVRIHVVNRAGGKVSRLEQASEVPMASDHSYAEVGWDPDAVRMRPIAEATSSRSREPHAGRASPVRPRRRPPEARVAAGRPRGRRTSSRTRKAQRSPTRTPRTSRP